MDSGGCLGAERMHKCRLERLGLKHTEGVWWNCELVGLVAALARFAVGCGYDVEHCHWG